MSLTSWIWRKLGHAATDESPGKQLLAGLDFLLLDIEVTGTDATQDTVIGLASLPLVDGVFHPGDLHYVNFADADAVDVSAGYQACLERMTQSVVVTINPNFIRHMLTLAADQHQLPPPVGNWLDLSAAASVIGGEANAATSLRQWQARMRSGGRHEHDAIYDVFAMAQLLQALLAYAEDSGIETLADLRRNQSAESWLRPY
ncbi:MAG: hypothetical protein CVU33_08210 [Betaproteobacteria bacterium HGW-Betaproteobacteria-6]|jgi:DNA polymerase III alpha subunit (gram-positive type)|nr:MAG: hypothetical protein CVU33_08210 [Betaproteobacteria bacterium HGW-Betaproteobacteria-6]